MKDDPLEQLRIELSVEPSPEFAAKVRARIAREPKRRWTTMAMWSLAAAAAVVVLAVVALRPRGEQGRPIAVKEAPSPVAALATPAAVGPPAPKAPAAEAAPATTPGPARHAVFAAVRHADVERAAAGSPRLEVLVPPDQRRAIDRLISDLNGGRLDPTVLAFASVDQQAELAKPATIAVAPIEIPVIGGLDIKNDIKK